MQIKELIDIINIYDIKVIFDNAEDVAEKIMKGTSPLYFTPVEGSERKKYKKKKNNRDFTSTTATIHIIDLSIDDFVKIFECDVTGIHEFTNNIINPYCNEKINRNIVYMIFLFLHEVGHWFQFKKMDRKVYDFMERNRALYEENFKKKTLLEERRQGRIDKGNQCKLTAKEKKLFEQYMKEYRNIPKENEADEFALSQMETSLKLYLNSCLSE